MSSNTRNGSKFYRNYGIEFHFPGDYGSIKIKKRND